MLQNAYGKNVELIGTEIWYKYKSVNKKNATLIFTTHYCELLDLFGRSDNIYISKYECECRIY